MPNKKLETNTKKEVVAKKTVKKDIVEAKIPMKTTKKEATMSIDVFDVKGGKTTMTLPAEVFGVKINKPLMAQAVRVYLANQRTGTAKSKTRGEVQGSTRKIYQQKGTGRARHGGIRAPLFVGGGVAHGPRPHDFTLSFPKKMRRLALFSALSSKKADGAIKIVKGMASVEAKTKAMLAVMKTLGMAEKKNQVMVVLPEKAEAMTAVFRSARNIAGVTLMTVNQLNTYEVLKTKTLLFMQEAIEDIKK
ncbi:MAG: 50S ribosomal protein L4 [Candidatus Levybacteria bacterium]|nr:50S ribosomal protein L4 [Candidatus Levybacteria bacterium]